METIRNIIMLNKVSRRYVRIITIIKILKGRWTKLFLFKFCDKSKKILEITIETIKLTNKNFFKEQREY